MPDPPPLYTQSLELPDTTLYVGQSLQYQCTEGHELVQGNLELLCSSTKTFIGDMPLCKGGSVDHTCHITQLMMLP